MFENLYDKHPPPEAVTPYELTIHTVKQLLHLLCFIEDGGIYTGFNEGADITEHLEELLRWHGIKLSEVI